jgi:hypothetical protein
MDAFAPPKSIAAMNTTTTQTTLSTPELAISIVCFKVQRSSTVF